MPQSAITGIAEEIYISTCLASKSIKFSDLTAGQQEYYYTTAKQAVQKGQQLLTALLQAGPSAQSQRDFAVVELEPQFATEPTPRDLEPELNQMNLATQPNRFDREQLSFYSASGGITVGAVVAALDKLDRGKRQMIIEELAKTLYP